MNSKEYRAFLRKQPKKVQEGIKKIWQENYEKYKMEWIAECASKNVPKEKAEIEIAFQFTKECYQPPGQVEGKIISEKKLKGLTVSTINRMVYCEALFCHEKTNKVVQLDREGNVSHLVCSKHIEELWLRHAVMQRKSDVEGTLEDIRRMYKEIERDRWFRDNVRGKHK